MIRDKVLTDWMLIWDAANAAGRMIVLQAFASEHPELLPEYEASIHSLDVREPQTLSRFRIVSDLVVRRAEAILNR